jgi:ribosomal protein S18 acetylase RimI-like enzyme
MVSIRPAYLERDRDLISAIDTSFETETIFDVQHQGRGYALVEAAVDPPVSKRFPLEDIGRLPEWESAWLALEGGHAVGVVATQHQSWNRRVVVGHFYIDAGWRRQGVGRRLLETALGAARGRGAEVAWLETSNLNVPAIRAYESLGFTVCGLDETLYHGTPAEGEVALFLARDL